MEFEIIKNEKLIKALIHNVQGLSFGNAQKLIRLGKVKVNGVRVKDNIDCKVKDIIIVYNIQISKPTVPVIYEDDNILIVNKPQGIECATRDKSSDNTYSLEELFADKGAIVVHRLDRLTEGLVILSKSKENAILLEKIFETNQIHKYYKAVVVGQCNINEIKTAYLKKDSKKAIVEIADAQLPDYKKIITEIRTEKQLDNNLTLLDIKLHTGKTHQIRAHLSHLGYPIINDTKYGKNTPQITSYKGYFLTSYKIKFDIDLDNKLSYLNQLDISIIPSWLGLIEK